jgi:hypothetical protein
MMLQISFPHPGLNDSGEPIEENAGLRLELVSLFNRCRRKGLFHCFLALLGSKSQRLKDFKAVIRGKTIQGSRYLGLSSIPIDQIQGSLGHSKDFDRNFYPVQERSRTRWIRIAGARMSGQAVPPIELVQLGKIYFVRDGHHRLSVARAFGEKYMDAVVTQVDV